MTQHAIGSPRLPKIKGAKKRTQTLERQFFENLKERRINRLAAILSIHEGEIIPPNAIFRGKHWDNAEVWHFWTATKVVIIAERDMLNIGLFVDNLGIVGGVA
jgi:hypothetical protein